MAVNAVVTGWRRDRANSRLDFFHNGVRIGDISGAAGAEILSTVGSITSATGMTVTAGGLTITAGGAVVTAGDTAVTAGNVRLGAIETFGTTEPTQWIVFKSGTQPAGAITTSSGLGANDTTVQKIIAASTINNVET